MGQSNGNELRSVLSNRYSVLESILHDGKTKPELVDELEHSRSTIDRAIEQLSDVGCVTREERRFRASPVGKTAMQSHREYIEYSDGIHAARPVLNALEPDDPVDQVMFRDAEIYVSNPQTPEVGLQRSIDLKQKASALRGYAPVVFEEYFDSQIEQLQRDDFRSEIIIESALFEQIQTHFKDKFEALVNYDRVSIYVTDRMISYAPWLLILDTETYAGMTVYDDGAIRGMIINSSDQAVSWMRQLLSSLTSSAEKVH